MVQLIWATGAQFLIKLNGYLKYDLAIPFLNICPGEMKTVHTHTCAYRFITALFLIAQSLGKQKIPINRLMVEQILLHLYNGNLCTKNNNTGNIDIAQKHNERSQIK